MPTDRLLVVLRRYVKYLLTCGVTVVVGLSPLLGLQRIPVFTPLLDLLPPDMQVPLVTLAAFLFGLVAAKVQFDADRQPSTRAAHRRSFMALYGLTGVVFGVLVVIYFLNVLRVPIEGGVRQIAVVIPGQGRLINCPCPGEASNLECVERLSLNPALRGRCWSERKIRWIELALALAYLGSMGGFGAIVGTTVARVSHSAGEKKQRSR